MADTLAGGGGRSAVGTSAEWTGARLVYARVQVSQFRRRAPEARRG